MHNLDKPYEYYQLIPEKILEKLPGIEMSIKHDISNYNRDCLLETINTVATRQRKNDDDEYIPAQIQVKYLKALVPQGDKYLKGLIQNGVIKRSGFYKPGSKSFEYFFSTEYHSKFIRIELKNPKLVRRVRIFHNKQKTKKAKSVRGRSEQVKYLLQLTIQPEVYDVIERHYGDNHLDSYNYAVSSATRIRNRDFSYSVDKTSFRFHSNITNMPKFMAPYLRIGGNPLFEVDIKNSQPFLSAGLLRNPESYSKLAGDPKLTLLLQSLTITDSIDIKKYIHLTTSGQIYEYLRDRAWKTGINISADPIAARQQVKKELFRIMFGLSYLPSNDTKRDMTLLFKLEFPKVWNIFNVIKGSYHEYNRFAILLQRVESYLMLDLVAKEIKRRNLGVFLTKHDSIYLTNNMESVSLIVKGVFEKFTGFIPEIK